MARRIVLTLLVIHSGLLAYSAYVHSPTLDEPGHLIAGLSHWKFGRFELYRVNPPLVRMVAALPVMAAGYKEDWSGFRERPGARPTFSMGENFVEANGEWSLFLFMIARWACIPFSWIGGIVCYLWARDLFGRPAGVMACALWCFSPNILAHASLITADAGGTALGAAACYTFWRWLKQPTWIQAALTGCVLGVAELAKTTLILFYPLWPALWVIYRWPDRYVMHPRDWAREAGMLTLRMAVGLYVLNLGYGFEGTGKRLGDFHFVSKLFSGRAESEELVDDGKQNLTYTAQLTSSSTINRFVDTCMASLPAPFPANYLIGIDIQQRDFEDYRRLSYLRGQWQDHGWWHYYLYAALIKIPLGTLVLVCPSWLFWRFGKVRGARQPGGALPLLAPALVIFSVCSAKTGFCEHFRYVLPCLPFLFIWVCGFTAKLDFSEFRKNFVDTNKKIGNVTGVMMLSSCMRHLQSAVAFLLLWSATSSLWIYPHNLSYFNEAIGGPLNGPKHLLGSNVDWGQDLRYVQNMIKHSRLSMDRWYLAYYGYYNPASIGLSETQDIAAKSPSMILKKGAKKYGNKIIISVNILFGSRWPVRDGKRGGARVLTEQELEELSGHSSAAKCGYSMRIFE